MHTYYGNRRSAKPAQASSEAMERQSRQPFSGLAHNDRAKMVYFGLGSSGATAGTVREGFSMKTIVRAVLEVGMFAGVIFGWLQFLALLAFGGVMVLTVTVLVKALI